MNIQRIQTGSVTANAAGQVQRGAREQQKARVEGSEPTRADAVDTARTQPASTDTRGVSPRLAAYAGRIEGRLSQLIQDRDLSPRQRAALEQAQSHFHDMIQQLDSAYENGGTNRQSIGSALQDIVAHLASSVNHIQSGGQLDVRG
jgi:hypothetical protein